MKTNWTPEQSELIEIAANGVPVFPRVSVSADAGSGKTTTLIERVRRLPKEKRILCVSFTEKSRSDLKERCLEFPHVDVFTIHGFCNSLISNYRARLGLVPTYSIVDAADSEKIFEECFNKVFSRNPIFNEDYNSSFFFDLCNHFRNQMINPLEIQITDFSGKCSISPTEFVQKMLLEFQHVKWKSGLLEYNDLERLAIEALENAEVRTDLQNKYQAVFVDEFQDTSRIQCALVQKLLFSKSTQLFVVGDPKQSIYRFRGAEVKVFQEFIESLPAQKKLSWNYRSHPEIIEKINKTFDGLMAGYQPMHSGRTKFQYDFFGDKLPRAGLLETSDKAKSIAQLIRALEKNGVAPNEMVLLFRYLRGNEDLLEQIKSYGISLRIHGSNRGSLPVSLNELCWLWIWSCDQNNSRAKLVVERAFGLELTQSFLKHTESSRASAMEQLSAHFSLASKYGVDFRVFQNFIQQIDFVHPNEIAVYLEKCFDHNRPIDGLREAPFPDQLKPSVGVMTIHASKGLEFPILILPDLEEKRGRSSAVFAKENKAWIVERDDSGKLVKKPLEHLVDEKNEAIAESQRLLYVAMTRAEEGLYCISEKKDKPDSEQSWISWLKKADLKKIESLPEIEPVSAQVKEENAELGLGFAEPSPSTVSAGIEVESVSRWIGQKPRAKNGGFDSSQSFLKMLSASSLGTRVHRLIETQNWNELEKYPFYKWARQSKEGDLLFFGETKRQYEVPFLYQVEGKKVLEGRMDLVVQLPTEDWIVDFKLISNPTTVASLKQKYLPQLELYQQAVKKMTDTKRCVRIFLLDLNGSSGQFLIEC